MEAVVGDKLFLVILMMVSIFGSIELPVDWLEIAKRQ